MEQTELLLAYSPKYVQLLGRDQAARVLQLFAEIEQGKYEKHEVHELRMNGFKHPFYIRAIRADMQSFVNTFIDPYLDKKPYLDNVGFVIDAGANIGCTAALYANWWPQASIISIEADRENYELTLRNMAAYPNVTVIHGALWNKETDLRIEAGQEDGFVVREINTGKDEVRADNLTRGISIEGIMKEYNLQEIGFLKMNIEGSEKEVFLEGADKWLSKTSAMLIELHDGKNPGCSKAVFNTISNYDFAVAETAPYGILFVKQSVYSDWYARWYHEEIYLPRINKQRFPKFYLKSEQ